MFIVITNKFLNVSVLVHLNLAGCKPDHFKMSIIVKKKSWIKSEVIHFNPIHLTAFMPITELITSM